MKQPSFQSILPVNGGHPRPHTTLTPQAWVFVALGCTVGFFGSVWVLGLWRGMLAFGVGVIAIAFATMIIAATLIEVEKRQRTEWDKTDGPPGHTTRD